MLIDFYCLSHCLQVKLLHSYTATHCVLFTFSITSAQLRSGCGGYVLYLLDMYLNYSYDNCNSLFDKLLIHKTFQKHFVLGCTDWLSGTIFFL